MKYPVTALTLLLFAGCSGSYLQGARTWRLQGEQGVQVCGLLEETNPQYLRVCGAWEEGNSDTDTVSFQPSIGYHLRNSSPDASLRYGLHLGSGFSLDLLLGVGVETTGGASTGVELVEGEDPETPYADSTVETGFTSHTNVEGAKFGFHWLIEAECYFAAGPLQVSSGARSNLDRTILNPQLFLAIGLELP